MEGSPRGLPRRGMAHAGHPTGTEPQLLLSASAQPISAAALQLPAALKEEQVGVTGGNPAVWGGH